VLRLSLAAIADDVEMQVELRWMFQSTPKAAVVRINMVGGELTDETGVSFSLIVDHPRIEQVYFRYLLTGTTWKRSVGPRFLENLQHSGVYYSSDF
jgi:hypothetical protein